MKKPSVLLFLSKYRSTLLEAFLMATTYVILYIGYLERKIMKLKEEIAPGLPWEERLPLIKEAKSELIVQGVIISILIILVLYFPCLMYCFRFTRKESFFECWRKYKDEKNS